jgi:hypothetical protein
VLIVQELWRRYPGEIASDLSQFHGRRIADWHRGTIGEDGYLIMASGELWEFLQYMDDDGAFKTALRDGEPSQQRKAILQTANETAVFRAGMVPGADGEQWGSQLFFTPSKLRELVESDEELTEARGEIMAIGSKTTTGETD